MSRFGNWFYTLIRQFFFSIDRIVFNFISEVYDLLIAIARTSPLSQSDIIEMADKIYKLLAVFMVFKVTLSLITYLVNPDDFSDKSKGISKLGTNIIISLSLLILTPYIFSYAYELQTIILEDNSLATLIFETSNQNDSSHFNTAGDKMAFVTMSAFLSPNVGAKGLQECMTFIDDGKVNDLCKEKLTALTEKNDKFTTDDLENYIAGIENQSLGLTFRADLIAATTSDGKVFIMEYKYIFSTVVGVIVILMLLSCCMDIAVRSIKLAFLQLIAPIPILSYVDPKSGKDGMFKKWYQMCFKTYLSLFVRLLALYFAVYIIGKINNLVDIVDGTTVTNFYIKIFMIIGALMFVKQFPKILEGLGIKLDGDGKFILNPLKKFENEAIGGKRIAGFARSIPAAGLAGAAAFGTNLIARKGNLFSAAAGAFSATGRGMVGAVKGEKFGKNFSKSYSGAMKSRVNRDDRRELGINAFEVAGENLKKTLYIPNESQKNQSKLQHLKEFTSSGKTIKTRAEGEIDKKAAMIFVDGQNLGALRDSYEILKNTQIQQNANESIEDYKKRVNEHAKMAAEANAAYFAARKKAVNAYVANADKLDKKEHTLETKDKDGNIKQIRVEGFNNAFSGAAAHDEIVVSNIGKMTQLNEDHNMEQEVNAEDIGATIQRSEDATAKIEGSREYRKAELIAKQAQKEKNSK